MKHFERIALVLAAGTLLVLTGGCSGPAGSGKTPPEKPADQKAAPPALPPVWKSATTGKYYSVSVSDSTFQAEWVSAPQELAQRGASIRSQAHRQGTRYVGSSESYLPCTVGTGKKEHIANWCHVKTGLEIDFVSPNRILGRGEALKKFDCAKCEAVEKEWKDFVWVPAEVKSEGKPRGGTPPPQKKP